MHREHLVRIWSEQGIDPRLVEAFMSVPREMFVAPDLFHQAYLDRPLPTIRGQSLSQPTTVMLMTHALEVQEGQKILEVGSGVGYQASLLGKLVGEKGKVITTEILPELVQMSRENFKKLGLDQVSIQEADGAYGVQEEAPFDRIIITAACPKIPEPLLEQLKDGGIIVAPVGTPEAQFMVKVVKEGPRLEFEFLGQFMFVPLQGKHGFTEEIRTNVME